MSKNNPSRQIRINNDKYQPLFLSTRNFTITNNNSIFTYYFQQAKEIRNKEMALFYLFIYYSWYNINALKYNNNTVSYTFNGTVRNIVIPDGDYEISDISNYIQLVMQTNGDYLVDNNNNIVYFISLVQNPTYYGATLTCTPIPSSLPTGWTNPNSITLSGETPTLNFNNSNFNLLLGYNTNTSYPATPQTSVYSINSVNTPEINPVYCVNVLTNMTNNDGLVNVNANVIYQFNPTNNTYGSQIQIEPTNLLFCKINDNPYNYLQITFTDQDGNFLPIRDVAMNMAFVTRDRE